MLGALGGPGKSLLLRAAASVFGASGDADAQPGGVVGRGTGTPKGLLLPYRRFSDLPHLLHDLRPVLSEDRQKNELASTLHQLHGGEQPTRPALERRDPLGSAFLQLPRLEKPLPPCEMR